MDGEKGSSVRDVCFGNKALAQVGRVALKKRVAFSSKDSMTASLPSARARRWVLAWYCLSGLLSLGYQVVWFRVFAERYGATPFTFGLVVLCFIGGLGLGAWHGARFCDWLGGRSGIREPLRQYGALELLVAGGLWLTFALQGISLPPAGGEVYSFPHEIDGGLQVWRIKLVWKLIMALAAMVALLIPCFFMGATFPLLCSVFQSDGRFPSELYAWNTLGACLGVLFCEFVALAAFGHHLTLVGLVAINVVLGAVFFWGAPGRLVVEDEVEGGGEGGGDGVKLKPSTALALAGLSGALAGALEADLFQQIRFSGYVLSAAMSFVSFWAILAIFLASLTVRASRKLSLPWLKAAVIGGCLIHLANLYFRYQLRNGIAEAFLPYSLDAPAVRSAHYMDAGLVSVFFFVGVFVFPAFYLVSLILPFACNQLQAAGLRLGRAYAINTLSFCGGLFAFSFLAPRVDIFYAFKLFLFFFVVAAMTIASLRGDDRRLAFKLGIGSAAVCLGALVAPRGFEARFFDAHTASNITAVRGLRSNGANTTYVVTDAGYPGERLYFDGYSMSGTALGDQQYMRLMAHFPLLAQPNPTSALQIGFGVGSTASSVALHGSIQRFDIVDLNHQVLATASEFAANNRDVLFDPRVRLFHDDGRNFLRLSGERYDLITSEPPPPVFEGVFRLYSTEYYELVLEHLTPSGMMTQWLPMNQLSQEAGDRITRSFVQTFPHATAFVGLADHLILVGSPQPISLRMIERRLAAAPTIAAELRQIGIPTPVHLLARVIASGESLKADYGNGLVIRDARNEFGHLIYRPEQPRIPFRPGAVLAAHPDLASRGDLMKVWSDQRILARVASDFPFWLLTLE